jgi:hypothetical protein
MNLTAVAKTALETNMNACRDEKKDMATLLDAEKENQRKVK